MEFLRNHDQMGRPLPIHLLYAIFSIEDKMTSNQKTVMIIEDEADAAELFAEMMRINGFRVIKMFSSAPAIPIISQEKPDLILLDVMMPDISGLEVLRYIRREPDLAAIPVIVVSAKSMPGDIKIGIEAGASLYLTKPVGFLDLKQAVEQVLNNNHTA
jgi:two-component system, OmpR family, phosphate regulon response regulator PhoB